MVTIVILDDGICEELLSYSCIQEHLTVSNGEIVSDSKKPADILTHGTRCANIIIGDLSSVSMVSIRLMDFGEKTTIENLICALKWCIDHLPSIIHMSLGSVLYNDGQKLSPYIQALTNAGVLIVAAFNNMEIPTWPACCPGVFGVRADKSSLLQDGEFLFDSKYRGSLENSIIAHCRTKTYKDITSRDSMSNSFAAPIITARLYQWMQGSGRGTFSDAKEYLQDISVKNVTNGPRFCDLRRFEWKSLKTPAIWVCASLLSQVAEMFRVQGYNVFECSDFGEGVPLNLYADNGVITDNLLRMVEVVYDPDAIIMGTNTPPAEQGLFDLQVSERGQKILIKSDEGLLNCSGIVDAFLAILGFFE